MTSKCERCALPLAGALTCKFCSASNSGIGRPPNSTSVAPPVPRPSAPLSPGSTFTRPESLKPNGVSWQSQGTAASSTQMRSLAYEVFLMIVTLGIGGLIWSWVAAFSCQTPAGKLRDEVIVNVRTGRPAPAWKLLVRQTLLFAAVTWVVLGTVIGFGLVLDVGGYWVATLVIPSLIATVLALDIALIFAPMRRRLIDWLLAIKIAEGNGYTYRNSAQGMGY
jgi:hypothetical protein